VDIDPTGRSTISATAAKGVLANDTSPDGDQLSVIAVSGAGGVVAPFHAVEGAYGTLALGPDGSYTYTPTGPSPTRRDDVFTYVVSDGNGGTATATLDIAIGAVVAKDVSATVEEIAGDKVKGNLLTGTGASTISSEFLTGTYGTLPADGRP
jgi:large repetitive protein